MRECEHENCSSTPEGGLILGKRPVSQAVAVGRRHPHDVPDGRIQPVEIGFVPSVRLPVDHDLGEEGAVGVAAHEAARGEPRRQVSVLLEDDGVLDPLAHDEGDPLVLPFGDDVARAAEGRAIGRAGDVAGIDVGRLTPSKKVLDYDYAYFNRPYNSSNLLIGEIISTGPPGPDPRGSAGMWWKVPGSLNGTEGTFEVLISPDGRMVWHFLFRSK